MLATSLFASAEPGVLQGGCGDTNRYHGVEDPHGCRQTGSFGIPREIANRVHAADWCFRRCDRLEGCNFISVSVSQRDCSWYRHCRLDRLQQNRVVTDIVSAPARQRSAAAEALAKARCRMEQEGRSHKRARVLNASSLNNAILNFGSRWPHLVSRLRSGAPIAMGVIGASVAQNAGCLTQPGKRCMQMSGQTSWTRTGWAVRMLQKINQSYPHHGHRIHNMAADATPAAEVLKCLGTHLPQRLDLVIVEFGSMARFMGGEIASVEGMVRFLLANFPSAEIVILSVHAWCEQNDAGDPLFYRDGEQLGMLAGSPWERVEQETLRVCRRYATTCVSVHKGLLPLVQRHEPGFDVLDLVGRDCLHPVNGRHGVDYIEQMLGYAFERAEADTAMIQSVVAGDGGARLTAPLHAANLHPTSHECLTFLDRAGQRDSLLQWTTTWCPSNDSAATAGAATSDGKKGSCVSKHGHARCPVGSSSRAKYSAFLSSPPPVWFACKWSLSPFGLRKQSPAVVALVPGATARAMIELHGVRRTELSLEYLASYAQMGRVAAACYGGCSCASQTIDAHRPGVRASTWEQRQFELSLSHHTNTACVLQLVLLHSSSSDSTRFSVRGLKLRRTRP